MIKKTMSQNNLISLIKQDINQFQRIPKEYKTEEFLLKAVQINPFVIEQIKMKKRTFLLCKNALNALKNKEKLNDLLFNFPYSVRELLKV